VASKPVGGEALDDASGRDRKGYVEKEKTHWGQQGPGVKGMRKILTLNGASVESNSEAGDYRISDGKVALESWLGPVGGRSKSQKGGGHISKAKRRGLRNEKIKLHKN